MVPEKGGQAMRLNHLLIAFLATLGGAIFLATAADQNLGGTLNLLDALVGLLLIEGGAIAQATPSN